MNGVDNTSNYTYLSDQSEAITSDEAIQRVNGFGRFQLVLVIIVMLTCSLPGHIGYMIAFLQNKDIVTVKCTNYEGNQDICDEEIACDHKRTASYTFDTENGVKNWVTAIPQMLCYSDKKISLQGVFYFIGFLIGSVVFLRLTDYWGRKWLLFFGVVFQIFIQLIYIIHLDINSLYVALFLLGIRAPLSVAMGNVYLLEMVAPKHRSTFAMITAVFDTSTMFWAPFVIEFGKSWWILYWMDMGMCVVLILPYLFYVIESPRFLISVNLFKQARQVYQKIAKINKRDMFKEKLIGEGASTRRRQQNVSGKQSLIFLCKSKLVRRPLIILPLLWFFVNIVYYGLNFGIGNLKGSIYLNGQISAGAEIISQVLAGILASTVGRRLSLSLSFLIGGIACILYYVASRGAVQWTYACLLIGKFGTACAFFMVHLLTVELIPTVYRGTFFGICTIFGRTGGMLAPLTNGFAQSYFMYIYGSFGILSGILPLFLRETKGKAMVDSEEEQEKKRNLEKSPMQSEQDNKKSGEYSP